jgi:hypothetical protein
VGEACRAEHLGPIRSRLEMLRDWRKQVMALRGCAAIAVRTGLKLAKPRKYKSAFSRPETVKNNSGPSNNA